MSNPWTISVEEIRHLPMGECLFVRRIPDEFTFTNSARDMNRVRNEIGERWNCNYKSIFTHRLPNGWLIVLGCFSKDPSPVDITWVLW